MNGRLKDSSVRPIRKETADIYLEKILSHPTKVEFDKARGGVHQVYGFRPNLSVFISEIISLGKLGTSVISM